MDQEEYLEGWEGKRFFGHSGEHPMMRAEVVVMAVRWEVAR